MSGESDARVRVHRMTRVSAVVGCLQGHWLGDARQFARQERAAKLYVTEEAFKWIGGLVIRRCGEKSFGHGFPMSGRAERQVILGLKVMKEAAHTVGGRRERVVALQLPTKSDVDADPFSF